MTFGRLFFQYHFHGLHAGASSRCALDFPAFGQHLRYFGTGELRIQVSSREPSLQLALRFRHTEWIEGLVENFWL